MEAILFNPEYRGFLSILKGMRNGVVYGTKIRAPHAFVMTMVFKNGTLLEKLKVIFQLTFAHAKNLFLFVGIYKTLLVVLKAIWSKNVPVHSFLAGGIGGWIVFGANTPVNQQINLYLTGRILMGLMSHASTRFDIPAPPKSSFLFGAVNWALVMWLFERDKACLQGSLRSSMTYLYHDSNKWSSWRDFLL